MPIAKLASGFSGSAPSTLSAYVFAMRKSALTSASWSPSRGVMRDIICSLRLLMDFTSDLNCSLWSLSFLERSISAIADFASPERSLRSARYTHMRARRHMQS